MMLKAASFVLLLSVLFLYQNCGGEFQAVQSSLIEPAPNQNEPSDDTVPAGPQHVVWDEEASSDVFVFIDSDGLTVEKNDGIDASQSASTYANVELSSGKWYFEVEILEFSGNSLRIGMAATTGRVPDGSPTSDATYGYEAFGQMSRYQDTNFEFIGTGTPYGVGDVVSVAVDLDNLLVEFHVNGQVQGELPMQATRAYSPIFYGFQDDNGKVRANFGRTPFRYAAPVGFSPLDEILSGKTQTILAEDTSLGATQASALRYLSRSQSDRFWGAVGTLGSGFVGFGETTSYSLNASLADGLAVKNDSTGTRQWSVRMGTSTSYDMILDSYENLAGALFFTGLSSTSGEDQALAVSLDAGGVFRWATRMGAADAQETLIATAKVNDAELFAAGRSTDSTGDSDGYFVHVNADTGNVLSQTRLGAGGNEYFEAIRTLSGGGAILSGITESLGAGAGDAWLTKIDAAGNVVWSRGVGGPARDIYNDAVELESGRIVAVGGTESFGAGDQDILISLFTAGGAHLASRTLGGIASDHASNVIVSKNQGLIISGVASSQSADGESDGFVLKITDDLNSMVWLQLYEQNGADRLFKARETEDRRIVFGGHSPSVGGTNAAFVGAVKADGSHDRTCLPARALSSWSLMAAAPNVVNAPFVSQPLTNTQEMLNAGFVSAITTADDNQCLP